MAYNLESLVRILDQILQLDQQRWIISDESRPQIKFLLEKASSLKQILQTSKPSSDGIMESLESRIRDVAHQAEDIIESHMVDQMLARPEGKSFTISPPDLQHVIEELDSMEKIKKIMDGNQMPNTLLPDGVSLTSDPSSKEIVVGLDADILHLKDRLTGGQSKLEIIPIVGVSGTGKTTLARYLYDDNFIFSYFDTCAWITISEDYNVRAILLGLLGCAIGKLTDELLRKKDSQLALSLYQCLSGKRYLIVLDDMWSTKVWDDIKMFFPKDNTGSRIILTTRRPNEANYVESSRPLHRMHFLNTAESWNLLQQTVFGRDINCPPELEKIGKNIVRSCGGHPFAIHVIGGLLSKGKRTTDFWEHVAADIKAAIGEMGDQVFTILSLSYNHLPNHLKPCFLYMGAFPRDYEIRASKLIKLWVAEGFLKSNGDKSLEEKAEECLKALVDRNLIVVTKRKSNGKAKSYRMFDFLRHYCISKANQEKFLDAQSWHFEDSTYSLRRVSVYPSYGGQNIYVEKGVMSVARSFLCVGIAPHVNLSPLFAELRLVRVLDVFDMEFRQFPTEILQLVNLRFLALYCNSALPSAISRLWNLQTLIFRSKLYWSYLPFEIMDMPDLRHITFKKTIAHIEHYYRNDFVREKLETISIIYLDELLGSNILGCFPNIKSLGILAHSSPTNVIHLYNLQMLETLKCKSNLSPKARTLLSTLRFPPSLRKLTLVKCTIPWRNMKTVASLPNLEVLKIRKCAFEGQENQPEDEEEWESTEEFCSLRFLLLENLNLVRWRADETNFPRLRHLVIRGCSALKEIPGGIGEIPTLKLIEVDRSSPSLVYSAKWIQWKYVKDYIEIRII